MNHMTDEYRDSMQEKPEEKTEEGGARLTIPAEQESTPAPQATREDTRSSFYNGPAPQPVQTPQPYGTSQGWGYQPAPQPPKKKKTGVVVGIVLAAVAYLVLLGLLLATLGGQNRTVTPVTNTPDTEEVVTTEEPGSDNAPIVTEKGGSGITNPDYTGEVLTPAELYKENVDSVVYVEAKYTNGKTMGSGFVIDDENGYILTNQHVVDGSQDVSVTLTNGESYTAKVIGGDEINDIAVLKVEAKGLRKVTIGDSDQIEIGSYVNIIGNPLGELTFTITRGVIGGVGRTISTGEYSIGVFQTDAAINGGNSGGPALDDTGAVIGIANAKYASLDVEGICFCIPINDAMKVAQDLVNYGYVKGRPNFGITVSTSSGYSVSTDEFGRRRMVETVAGAVVEQVGKDSCAEKAGLQAGDIITKLNDTKISTASELINTKLQYNAGDTVTLEVFRDEQIITVSVTLDELQPD